VTPAGIPSSDEEALKRAAANRVVALVRPGMVLGLGTGSTAYFFIEGVGHLVQQGIEVLAIPSSRGTAELARSFGVPLSDDTDRPIDLAVDGADEIDPTMQLVKGHGGALTREKLVVAGARKFVVIADESKLVPQLGQGPIPAEVLPFLWRHTAKRLEQLGGSVTLRQGPTGPFVTDSGNFIVDLQFPSALAEPELLATQLKQMVGVVEHGLFLNLAHACVIGSETGIRVLGSLD
jgi:ribose 5-phosphate isomerase A